LAATLVVGGAARAQVEMGPELQVNTTTTGMKTSSAVAVRPDGGFVVVWDSDQNYSYPEVPNASSFHDVFLRRFTPADEPLGPETQVNVHTITSQQRPAVAPRSDGGFVVAWQSGCLYAGGDGGCSPDGDGIAVAARLFDADANGGPELLVNSFTPGRQYFPEVAAWPRDEGFVVTWRSYDAYDASPDRDLWTLSARTFDAAGAPTSDEILVATVGAAPEGAPAGADALGRFVVVWSGSEGGNGYEYRSHVVARRFDAEGTEVGGLVVVSDQQGHGPRGAAVAVAPDGGFVAVWESFETPPVSLVARRFGPDGGPIGDEIPVNTHTTGAQHDPSIAADAAGNFVVVWSSQDAVTPDGARDASGIFGQAFAPDGTPLGDEFAVNLATAGTQLGADIAANAVGDFVVSWTHWGDFSCTDDEHEPCGIRARRLRVTPCTEDADCDGGCLLGTRTCVQGRCTTPPGCPYIVVADATPVGDDAALETTIKIPEDVPGQGPVAVKITARIAGGDARGPCRASRLVGRLNARLTPGSGMTLPLRLDRQGGRCLAIAPGGEISVLVRVQVRRGHTPLADFAAERLWTR
jgi:hypothetical protein